MIAEESIGQESQSYFYKDDKSNSSADKGIQISTHKLVEMHNKIRRKAEMEE
jgi:hypothetical protein